MYIYTSSTKTLKTFKYAFSSTFLITFKNFNLHNKGPKILAFHTFGLKYCLNPCMLLKLSKRISPQKLIPSDYICTAARKSLSKVKNKASYSHLG